MQGSLIWRRDSRSGAAGWLALIGILIALGVLALIVLGWYIGYYNRAVRLQEGVQKAWGDVDAVLTRRFDLVPNLVNTVKGYATHEQEVFDKITAARAKYNAAANVGEKAAIAAEFDRALVTVLAIAEANPQLRASENFRDLQVQLEGTENRIAVARTRYNEAVKELNSFCRSFFGRFFCERAKVEMAEYYQAPEITREAPRVEF
mgnify:CR=1 FL=1